MCAYRGARQQCFFILFRAAKQTNDCKNRRKKLYRLHHAYKYAISINEVASKPVSTESSLKFRNTLCPIKDSGLRQSVADFSIKEIFQGGHCFLIEYPLGTSKFVELFTSIFFSHIK